MVTGTGMGRGRLTLSAALGPSDLNRALVDGRVEIQGVDLVPLVSSSPERHWRMFRQHEFDIAEVSFGAYLSINQRRPGEFVAIPAFPHRRFRHSYLFTGHDREDLRVHDLAGRRIGLRTWTNTAGIWTRGILQDRYGLDLSGVTWVMQDPDTAGTENLPSRFRIESVATGESVVDLTARGEIDALIYPETPDLLGQPGGLRRLFDDPAAEERAYFAKTGIFPIMHTVVLRGALVEQHPWLPLEVLRGFRAAKDRALRDLANPRTIALAWVTEAYEQQLALMGPDPWGYDAATSAPALETLIRYAVEQGIVSAPVAVDRLFHRSCLAEPPRYVRR